jgi:EAL domain-containing protein (putative c-di-GMP-specific phosphodiesterase class I)
LTDANEALVSRGLHRILLLARQHLEMDLAFVTEFSEGKQVYRGLAGDADSFGCELGGELAVAETYCQLMISGQIPNAISDTTTHPVVRGLAVTHVADIGCYVGVPIHLSDGSVYGSLCAVNHTSRPVDERDAKFLRLLAELLAAEVQAEQEQAQERAHIQHIIRNERLTIALQPIVDLQSGVVLGVEALSRFPHRFGSPDVVFRAAHLAGVGIDLERLAARLAFETVPLLGPEVYLAINLSPAVAIQLAGLVLETSELPVDRLILEITEHSAVESYAMLRDSLGAVRRCGLRLAIDDAGAGYASLQHIVELAPDLIKADRSLVDGVAHDRARQSVVRALVGVAADLDAVIVAEGVERPDDLDTIRGLDVDAAQGYLFARPSTDRTDVTKWIASGLPR